MSIDLTILSGHKKLYFLFSADVIYLMPEYAKDGHAIISQRPSKPSDVFNKWVQGVSFQNI